ncbi:MAG: SNF2-related protein [Oligoflexales bacterium]
MSLPNSHNTGILEYFFRHVEEDDWLEGLDLYQAGKVTETQVFGDLVTAKVGTRHDGRTEVRVKIHPSGKCIQWMECTCRKNRTSGKFCEHMSAFMINMDRERPQVFKDLDAKMPMKPPTSARKPKLVGAPVAEEAEPKEQVPAVKGGAAERILSHLRGSIHSVNLVGTGPRIKIKLEIKTGQLTFFTLDIDEAAKFLTNQKNLKSATDDVKELKVFSQEAFIGTHFYQVEDEKVVAEKVVAIETKGKKDIAGEFHFKDRTKLSDEEPQGRKGDFELIPLKSVEKNLGKNFFYLPGRGYWPISRTGMSGDWAELPFKKVLKDDQAARVVTQGFTAYRSGGPIWLESSLTDMAIEHVGDISEVKVHSASGGWFYLDPLYQVGSDSVSMLDLMQHFRKKKRTFLKAGKKWIEIPEFIKNYEWDLDESGKFIKVDAVGLMRIRAAIGDFDRFVGSKNVLNQLRNQTEFVEATDVPELGHTKLDLREYQQTGYAWFWWLYNNHLHGLLADEMGLGKTHQAMALLSGIQVKKPEAKFLVVCPTTVLDHWMDKINAFCPNLKALKHHGPKRFQDLNSFTKKHDTLVTSYGVLLRDIKTLATDVEWDAIILDEAHFVKNNDTATYKAICKLSGKIRLCLSGTPIENNLAELKSIFDFLVPGYLGSDEYFRKNFINPISNREADAQLALQKLIHPFKIRRIKENVLKDLPAKVEDVRHCGLSAEQTKLYKNVLSIKASPLIRQMEDKNAQIPYLHVFATLNLLKQICNHPALILDGVDYRNYESDKFELFKELLAEALGSGHKVVVFSQYVNMIKIFQSYLTENKIGHAVLTGQTRNRGEVIERFQTDPDSKIFLGSLLAGGIGIDLTAASVVIHYDRWWNASKENQATDRVHRIGQNKNVQVMKLITRGTLEEKIDAMISAKKELFETFMDKDEEIFKRLDRRELIELLQ